MTKTQALTEMQEVLDRTANEMLLTEEEEAFTEWKRDSRVVLRHIFGENSDEVDEFAKIRYGLLMYTNFTTRSDIISARLEGIREAKAILQSMIKQVAKYGAKGITEKELADVQDVVEPEEPRAKNIQLLQEIIDECKQFTELQPLQLDSNQIDSWVIKARDVIELTLSPRQSQEFAKIDFNPDYSKIRVRQGVSRFEAKMSRKRSALRKSATKLEAWLWSYKNLNSGESNLSTTNFSTRNMQTNKVFIVHGHDELAKHKVRTFLTALGLEPVILHEQVNGGKTILKKFEANSNDVVFAVILLTADDEGRKKGTEQLKPRARQNVIFELGYFSHALGEGRVFCLVDDGVVADISDYSGVLFEPLDAKGAWGSTLAQELDAAGVPIIKEKLMQALQAIK